MSSKNMRNELEKTKGPLAELREWRTAVEHHRNTEWRSAIQKLAEHRANGEGAHGWQAPKRRGRK
jgi:hypothetical protein